MPCLLLKMSIPDAIRQIVRKQAKFVCEYCHSPERLSASRFTLDHLIPVSLGSSGDVDSATEIKGITAVGRATCDRFDLNDLRYPQEDSIRATRLFWIQTGLHPPDDDVCEV